MQELQLYNSKLKENETGMTMHIAKMMFVYYWNYNIWPLKS